MNFNFNDFKKLFEDFYTHQSWRHGPPQQTVEQAWDQLNDFTRNYWPQEYAFCAENLRVIVDGCLWDFSWMTPNNLLQASWSWRDHLKKHVTPQPAPAVVEPAPAQPKLEGRDSLGEVSTTEKPISSIQGAPTATIVPVAGERGGDGISPAPAKDGRDGRDGRSAPTLDEIVSAVIAEFANRFAVKAA